RETQVVSLATPGCCSGNGKAHGRHPVGRPRNTCRSYPFLTIDNCAIDNRAMSVGAIPNFNNFNSVSRYSRWGYRDDLGYQGSTASERTSQVMRAKQRFTMNLRLILPLLSAFILLVGPEFARADDGAYPVLPAPRERSQPAIQ